MSAVPAAVRPVAEQVLAAALARPPRLPGTRLVCVDGPAGSGKTTLAAVLANLAAQHGSVDVLHMDDMLEGWRGLPGVLPRVAADLVDPLRSGRPGRYRRYDWAAGRFAETHTVGPVDVLVLEGVGSGGSAYDDAITTLVWVEVPRDLRLARGVERDGEQVRAHWLTWMQDEDAVHARERTRERADILVDGTGGTPPVLRHRAGRSST
ncbi:MAG TPA: 4-amino-4-deoxy-L-arabinose transferase [Nocardioidaceae bacterium]|nr:4-amino-4-deoxy-L-arabinose transferase [Nocardioidaceae bacterium]